MPYKQDFNYIVPLTDIKYRIVVWGNKNKEKVNIRLENKWDDRYWQGAHEGLYLDNITDTNNLIEALNKVKENYNEEAKQEVEENKEVK